ncbi:MAG: ribose-phosphate diphosphokinase [bacterium]
MDKPPTWIFAWPEQEALGRSIATRLGLKPGVAELRRFPDGESYVRVLSPVAGEGAVVLASLDRPDAKLVSLLWLLETLRDLGARRVVLAAPYLAYLRQDTRFQEGEGVTSRYCAKLLSSAFDALLTVEPHLHRYASLDEIYTIPSRRVGVAPELAAYIRTRVESPFLLGPDRESEQWVSQVAELCGAPFAVAEKTRHGDRSVAIRLPDLERFRGRQPVLVDDILSTATTMIEALSLLKKAAWPAPLCVGVHGLFAGEAYAALLAAGPAGVATCNGVPHSSNAIDISEACARALEGLL